MMPPVSRSESKADHGSRRRATVRAAGASVKGRIDAVLISRPQDVGYLTGFTGDDSFLLTAGGWARLITDGRFAEQAQAECGEIQIHVRKGSMAAAVGRALKGRRARRIAVQGEHLTVAMLDRLNREMPGKRFRPMRDVLARLRAVKDAQELRRIRMAVRIAERAFLELVAQGAAAFIGRTERHVAAELEYRMRLAGADAPAFPTIVAAGPHASLPHYRPGATKIKRGQAVLIDWGALAGGYCSDLTRVVFIGRIPPKLRAVYEAVLRAQQAGISALRAGVAGRSVDAAARKVIEAAGYGDLAHGLGHGIGRQVHEAPVLGRTGAGRLRAGMVTTVEPGIYLPGVGGVRIEDDVLVAAKGRRRLSRLRRAMEAMVLR